MSKQPKMCRTCREAEKLSADKPHGGIRKTGRWDVQSASLPTARALPLIIGTSACPVGQLAG